MNMFSFLPFPYTNLYKPAFPIVEKREFTSVLGRVSLKRTCFVWLLSTCKSRRNWSTPSALRTDTQHAPPWEEGNYLHKAGRHGDSRSVKKIAFHFENSGQTHRKGNDIYFIKQCLSLPHSEWTDTIRNFYRCPITDCNVKLFHFIWCWHPSLLIFKRGKEQQFDQV